MHYVYEESESLDKRCYENFALSPEILMEHAGMALAHAVKKKLTHHAKVLFVCGSGNNGADGMVAARLLSSDFHVALFIPYELKSELATLQLKRAQQVGVVCVSEIEEADVYVDALFGSGLNRTLDTKSFDLINELNAKKGYKIACDIPSGLMRQTDLMTSIFKADETLTMGALKSALFHDFAKDFVGKINVAPLGITRKIYEIPSDIFLLQKKDLKLPFRQIKNTNKGSFGHVAILRGEKEGACLLSAMAAFYFGAGLVSIIGTKIKRSPAYLMHSFTLPKNANVIVAGMGMEEAKDEQTLQASLLDNDLPLVIDASLCQNPFIRTILKAQKPLVITPHPKEFSALLSLACDITASVEKIQKDRFDYAKRFSTLFPHVVLVLKGANTLIVHQEKIFINTFGTPALSKGGSGDVLAGMIGSLIAQGYTLEEAAIHGSLAHTLSAKKLTCNNYALTPIDLCKGLKWL
ncbi:MAG: NAD(P)H-hydrate dehydratase [Sulfurospirillaceae bacterium]|nr:NAD(P)H-hydrate dehydratase [Sulfurospirillaceae bacterium]